jgi:hypothetical protein
MRKFFPLMLAVVAMGMLTLSGCTDAGDPVFPEGSTIPVIITVTDMVGGVDNMHVNGALTGDSPVAMTQKGLDWEAEIDVAAAGTYGYGLYTDDGTKALVEVVGGLSVTVAEGGGVTGDTEIARNPEAGTGFRMVVYNGNPAYDNIKIKGAMNEWTADITGYNAEMSVFFLDVPGDLDEGSYEWGVIQDDGTEFGIWLLPAGPNLSFAIDAQGIATGDLSFTIASPQPETTLTFNCDMNSFEGSFSTVHVRGSYDGWAQTPTNLTDADEDGIYTVTLNVEQNMDYLFKFITDGSNYEDVPSACGADDGYGGYNRSISVGTDPVTFTAPFAGCPAGK